MNDIIEVENKSVGPISELSPLVQAVISGAMSPDTMAQMLAIQKDHEANEARKAFYAAQAGFKTEEIIINLDKENDQFGSKYMSKGSLVNTVNPILAKHGLVASWSFPEQGDRITVQCTLSHSMGHSESVSLSGPPDDSGKKNRLQQIKSTVTYLEITTYEAVTGVSASNAGNDDGNGAGDDIELITTEQIDTINARIDEHQITAKFLKWLSGPPIKCGSIEEIQAGSFELVQKRIDSAIRAQEKK